MLGWEKIKKYSTYHYSSFALNWESPISGETWSSRLFTRLVSCTYLFTLVVCRGLWSWRVNSMFGWEKDIKKYPTYHYRSFALAWWSPISGKTRSSRFFIGRNCVPIFLLFCYGNVYRLMNWKANSMLGSTVLQCSCLSHMYLQANQI